MAGTISLSLQQQFSASTGELLSGGKLYLYASGTLNPQNAYRDAALGTALPNPIILAADGRVPFLWFADGTIRVRMTDAGGTVQFDQDNIAVVGSSGGGGVDTTDPNSIAATGDIKFRIQTGTISGWVRLNGRSIGTASSGASERANADTQSLYEYLWNNLSDSVCPVSSGRGGSAALDFVSNKILTLPSLRGRTVFGLDDMGNSSASVITSATFVTPTTAGTSGGAERHTLTTSEISIHSHPITDPGHAHTLQNATQVMRLTNPTSNFAGGGVSFGTATITVDSNTTGITATDNAGGGGAHNNMPPGILGTWYIRL